MKLKKLLLTQTVVHTGLQKTYLLKVPQIQSLSTFWIWHVSENHRKFMKNLKQLKEIMPARLQRDKEKLKDCFANDFSKRCQAEYEQPFEKSTDFAAMKQNLSYISDAIIDCYFGDHGKCSKFSYACSKSIMTEPGYKKALSFLILLKSLLKLLKQKLFCGNVCTTGLVQLCSVRQQRI